MIFVLTFRNNILVVNELILLLVVVLTLFAAREVCKLRKKIGKNLFYFNKLTFLLFKDKERSNITNFLWEEHVFTPHSTPPPSP